MSTSGGYHEYIGGCSVHRRDIMLHVGEQLDKILSISIENSDVLNGSRTKSLRTKPPGQNPPGQNPPLYSIYNILPPKF